MTIQQARENEIILQINNREEYEKVILEMKKLYTGWHSTKFNDYASKGLPFYIDVKYDLIRDLVEFDSTPRPISVLDHCEINNSYSIY